MWEEIKQRTALKKPMSPIILNNLLGEIVSKAFEKIEEEDSHFAFVDVPYYAFCEP